MRIKILFGTIFTILLLFVMPNIPAIQINSVEMEIKSEVINYLDEYPGYILRGNDLSKLFFDNPNYPINISLFNFYQLRIIGLSEFINDIVKEGILILPITMAMIISLCIIFEQIFLVFAAFFLLIDYPVEAAACAFSAAFFHALAVIAGEIIKTDWSDLFPIIPNKSIIINE